MKRGAQTLPLLFLLALAVASPAHATAPCGRGVLLAAAVSTGHDDVTVLLGQQQGASEHPDAGKPVATPSGGERKLIATLSPFADADATEKGGVRGLLDKEHATAAELRQGNAKLQTVLRRRRESATGVRSVTVTVSASRPHAPLSPPHAPPPPPTLAPAPKPTPKPPAPKPTPKPPPINLTKEERIVLSKKLVEEAKQGHVDEIHQLLSQGADVHYRNEAQETPLHWAAWRGHAYAVDVLIDHGAPLNARNVDLYAPMNFAAWSGCVSCVHALAAAGANVDARNKDGWTPLHEAANYNQEGAIRALLQLGADPGVRNHGGKTARHYTTSDAIRALLPNYE